MADRTSSTGTLTFGRPGWPPNQRVKLPGLGVRPLSDKVCLDGGRRRPQLKR